MSFARFSRVVGRRTGLVVSVLALAALTLGVRRPTGFGCTPTLARFLDVTIQYTTTPQFGGTPTTVTLVSQSFVNDSSRTTTVTADVFRASTVLFGGTPISGDVFIPFRTVRWLGDPDAYVDVFFDTSIVDSSATPPVTGAETAAFVRYQWPGVEIDNGVVEVNPLADAQALGLPATLGGPDGFPFSGATALRFYDMGACSADLAWRPLAQAFVDELDARITDGFAHSGDLLGCQAHPLGNWELTPILHGDGTPDAFRISRNYDVANCAGTSVGTLHVHITGHFAAMPDLSLAYVLESATASGPGSVNIASTLNTVFAPAVNAAIPLVIARRSVITVPGSTTPLFRCTPGAAADAACVTRITSISTAPTLGCSASNPSGGCANGATCVAGICRATITSRNAICVPVPLTQSRLGGACALVPNFSRVYERPEGVELVLSEWGEDDREYNASHVPDPLYPLLVQNPSTCDVPVSASGPATYRVQSTATVGGYMGTIFELPPQGTPLPFGDHP